MAAEIEEAKSQFDQAIRERVEAFRKLRHERDCGRSEVLELFGKVKDIIDELDPSRDQIRAIEESSAKMAALRRTTIRPPEIGPLVGTQTHDARQDSFDETQVQEDLDRYYSCQLADRLEHIVERASSLDAVQLHVTSNVVRDLFQEAHEAYLYGFGVACIALCRSLLDHALKDKLGVQAGANVSLLGKPTDDSLINRAVTAKLLGGPELVAAKNVARSGNDVMHNVPSLRRGAQEVLEQTRVALNALYAASGTTNYH